MRKILFLDVDGVLNTSDSLLDGEDLAEEKLQLVKRIVAETGCDIVISSTWRLYPAHLRRVAHAFRTLGIPQFVGVTPNLETVERHVEIQAWMDANAIAEQDIVVVIDDDVDAKLPSTETVPCRIFARTFFKTGLTPELTTSIINVFNGVSNDQIEHTIRPITLGWTVQFCTECHTDR